jgi:hypothetical protein
LFNSVSMMSGTNLPTFLSRVGHIDIPADSRFFGKPPDAEEMIAQMRSVIGHA